MAPAAPSERATVAGWTVRPGQSPDVVIAERDLAGERADAEFWALLRSDAHHDNALADNGLERLHLDEAMERDAAILDIGDLFCVMQGRHDRRRDPRQAKHEFTLRYFDSVLGEAVDFYEPYARNWLMMTPGNHESAVLTHNETDLTSNLAARLNERTGSRIHRGPYRGFVIFRIWEHRAKTRKCQTVKLAYHHGYGGGGPVSKGVIQSNRQAVYLPDADIVWNGHIHEAWQLEIPRHRLTSSGRTYMDTAYHIRTPGYKDEFSGGEGWHVERGGAPKPLGAFWLRFYWKRQRMRFKLERAEGES